MFDSNDIIYSYSREQAIEDGVLIDITDLAQECGFKWSVAVTSGLYEKYIKCSDEIKSLGQSETGRIWDILTILRYEVKKQEGQEIQFSVYFLMQNHKKELAELKAVAGPGDNGEGVLTIMLPNED